MRKNDNITTYGREDLFDELLPFDEYIKMYKSVAVEMKKIDIEMQNRQKPINDGSTIGDNVR